MSVPIAELLGALPTVFQYIQIIGYIVLLLFFGSIAMKGWRGFLRFYIRWPARIGIGFLCLIAGMGLSPYIPVLSTGIFKVFQSDVIAGGIITAIIISIGLYLISFRSPRVVEGMRREIQRLHDKINSMRGKKPSKTFTIAGVIIIVAVLGFGLINFRGFPSNIAEEFISSIVPEMGLPGGITMGPGMSKLSPDCMTALYALSQNPQLISGAQPYENSAVREMVEQQAGSSVLEMYSLEYQGKTIIFASMSDNRQCLATESELCACQEQGQ